jgi:hypothetical protein
MSVLNKISATMYTFLVWRSGRFIIWDTVGLLKGSSFFYACYYSISCGVGEVVIKPAWGKDQPNNYNGEQNCVVLDGGRNWLWNDVGCNLDYLHWICQHSKCIALFKLSHE